MINKIVCVLLFIMFYVVSDCFTPTIDEISRSFPFYLNETNEITFISGIH